MSRPTARTSASAGRRPAQARRLHVAIIMDGNGRWAKQRGLPRTLGHRAGVARAEAHGRGGAGRSASSA